MADEKITQYDIGYRDVLCTGVKWRYPEKNIFYFTKDGKDYKFEERYYIDSQSDTDYIRSVIVNQFLPWWKNERIKELEAENDVLRERMNKTVTDIAERIKMEFYYEFDELIPSIMADKIDEIVKEVLND